jgi:hypothetical protein
MAEKDNSRKLSNDFFHLLSGISVDAPIVSDEQKYQIPTKGSSEAKELPNSVDHRPHLTEIRKQSRGDCGSFAMAAMREYHVSIQSKTKMYLSPRFLYDVRDKSDQIDIDNFGKLVIRSEVVSGVTIEQIAAILQTYGICPEFSYPYQDITYENTQTPPKRAFRTAEAFKIDSIRFLTGSSSPQQRIQLFKNCLANIGPVVVGMSCFPNADNVRFWAPVNKDDKPVGGHAVCLVGYDSTGFILRNSWGEEWGQNGYAIVPYTDIEYIGYGVTIVPFKKPKAIPWPLWKIYMLAVILVCCAVVLVVLGYVLYTHFASSTITNISKSNVLPNTKGNAPTQNTTSLLKSSRRLKK